MKTFLSLRIHLYIQIQFIKAISAMEEAATDTDRIPFTLNKEQIDFSNQDTNLRTITSHMHLETTVGKFRDYLPRSAYVDVAKMKASGNLKLKKSSGFSYYGQIVNGKRHGMGITLFQDGRVFQGQWRFDKKHGKGYQQFTSGNCYEGQYVQGKPEGMGKYYWQNGQIYDGQWFNGLKHGAGTWRGTKGDSYVGEWKNGMPDGFGVHIWANGDRYEGYFKQCLKHGEGVEKYASGDLFRGNFEKGKKNGHGEYYWKEGGWYKGNFVNGVREGKGFWKSSSGDTYDGQYKNGKKDGYGVYIWSNGTIYRGHFVSDIRQGQGQMLWKDGSYYRGGWKAGNQYGKGQIFCPFSGKMKYTNTNNTIIEVKQQEVQSSNYLNTSISNKILANNPNAIFKQRKLNKSRGLVESKLVEGSNAQNGSQLQKIEQEPRYKTQGYSKQKWKTGVLITRHTKCKSRATDKEVQTLKLCVSRLKKHTVDFSAKMQSPINQYKVQYRKEHIPHSSFYVHQLHRRTKTSNKQHFNQTDKVKQQPMQKSKSEDKPYNLSRLMRHRGFRYNN